MTTADTPAAIDQGSGWKAFWNRGGWWKAVLLAVVYLALYLAIGTSVAKIFSDQIDTDDIFSSAKNVFLVLGVAVIAGSIILLLFSSSLGWLRELFGRQPIGGSRWMWLAPIAVIASFALRAAGTDYTKLTIATVLVTYLVGFFVGFAEELLTRGLAVNLLRRGGYGEKSVMVLSSVIFAVLHSSNILGGQAVTTVLATVVFAFVFGVAMYLALRVTGSLWWVIILHGITDPSTFLASGGVDTVSVGDVNPLVAIGGLAPFVFAVLTIIALFAVKGRVGDRSEAQVAEVEPA